MFFSGAVERMGFSKAAGYFGGNLDDIVNFSLGEPRDPPPKAAVEAYAQSLAKGGSRYAPVRGRADLLDGVTEKLLEKNGIDASEKEVMITSGASEALAFSIMSLIGRGDEAVILQPSYPIMDPMVRFCGGRPVSLLLSKEHGFAPDIETLKGLVGKKTKMLLLNTPHNPTGTVLSSRTLRAISEIYDGPIVCDEVYENFTYGSEHRCLASLAKEPGRIITVNSFSKTYCMCGYRVGYVHAQEDMIRQMVKLKLCISTCTSNPAQSAALAALSDRRFPDDIKKKFEERRNVMVKGLRELGFPLVEPKGAFYVFPDVRELGTDDDACGLFRKAGVLSMPGSVFHERCSGHVRMSFVAEEKEIMEGISRLEGVLA
jgi:aspartate/methionine/tyrosine aminotransferase